MPNSGYITIIDDSSVTTTTICTNNSGINISRISVTTSIMCSEINNESSVDTNATCSSMHCYAVPPPTYATCSSMVPPLAGASGHHIVNMNYC